MWTTEQLDLNFGNEIENGLNRNCDPCNSISRVAVRPTYGRFPPELRAVLFAIYIHRSGAPLAWLTQSP
jgi:hypothetical protein